MFSTLSSGRISYVRIHVILFRLILTDAFCPIFCKIRPFWKPGMSSSTRNREIPWAFLLTFNWVVATTITVFARYPLDINTYANMGDRLQFRMSKSLCNIYYFLPKVRQRELQPSLLQISSTDVTPTPSTVHLSSIFLSSPPRQPLSPSNVKCISVTSFKLTNQFTYAYAN